MKINIIILLILSMLFSNDILNARTKVSVLFPGKKSDEPWKTHERYIKQESVRKNINLLIFYAEYSNEKQFRQMEISIATGVDVVILIAADHVKAGPMVDMASQKGIEVITYRTIPKRTRNISLHLDFDYSTIGKMKAKYLLDRKPSGNYMIFMGSPIDYIELASYNELMNTLDPYIDRGSITILSDRAIFDDSYDEAYSLSSVLFDQTGSEIDVIVLPNDTIAKAVINAMKNKKLSGKVYIAGENIDVESAQRIVLGKQDMSILLDDKLLALRAIELAEYLSNNQFIPIRDKGRPFVDSSAGTIPTFYVEPILITKENLDIEVISTGIMSRKEIYTSEVLKELKLGRASSSK